VAEGEADAMFYPYGPGTKKWDTCAGEAIVKALGGKVLDAKGIPITYYAEKLNNDSGVLMYLNEDEKMKILL